MTAPEIPATQYAQRLAEAWTRPASILVVEDDENLHRALEEMAHDYRVNFVRATSGETGLLLLGEQSFQAILLDLRLPGISGFEVFQEIVKRKIDTPVCVLTGMPLTERLIDDLYAIGWCMFCRKPQDFTRDWFKRFFSLLGIQHI